MSTEQIRSTLHRGARARVVWLNGVIVWGLSAAVIWCAAMWLLRSETDLAEDIVVALTLFPIIGYVAGRMMWRDRLRSLSNMPTANLPVAVDRNAAAEVEPTWSRAITIWWALTWRSLIAMSISVTLGAMVGGMIGGLAPGALADIGSGLAQLFGGGVGLVASLVPVKLILGKDFGEFRLVLLGKRPRPRPSETWTGELGAADRSPADAPTPAFGQTEPEPGPER